MAFQIGQHRQYTMEDIQKINWPQTTPFEENGILCKPNDLIDDLTVEHWFIQNDVLHHPNANDIFAVKSLPKFTSIPEGDSGGKSFKRLHRWRYSPTAAYGNNEVHLHPYLPRRISVAEALAIQSLPSDSPCLLIYHFRQSSRWWETVCLIFWRLVLQRIFLNGLSSSYIE